MEGGEHPLRSLHVNVLGLLNLHGHIVVILVNVVEFLLQEREIPIQDHAVIHMDCASQGGVLRQYVIHEIKDAIVVEAVLRIEPIVERILLRGGFL